MTLSSHGTNRRIGPAVRADFRRLYPANAKTSTYCSSDDNRTKVTNSVTSARSLWWHVGPYFWPADLTRTANPINAYGGPVGWVRLSSEISAVEALIYIYIIYIDTATLDIVANGNNTATR